MNEKNMKLLEKESEKENLKGYVVLKECQLYTNTSRRSKNNLKNYEYQYEFGEETKYIMFDNLDDAKEFYNNIDVKYSKQDFDLYNEEKEILQIDNYQKLNKENKTLEDVLSDGEYEQLDSESAKEKAEEREAIQTEDTAIDYSEDSLPF